jgi:hypothetical protein
MILLKGGTPSQAVMLFEREPIPKKALRGFEYEQMVQSSVKNFQLAPRNLAAREALT